MTSTRVGRWIRPLLGVALCVTVFSAVGCTQLGLVPEKDAPLSASEADRQIRLDDTTPTVPLAQRIAPPETGAYTGVFSPPAPFDMTGLDDYEFVAGKRAAILMWYQPWTPEGSYQFDSAATLAAMRRGSTPMITWEPWDPNGDPNYLKNPELQPEYNLKAIANGEFDAYITEWAVAIKRLGGPVMLRPMHEMNGRWYPWCGTVNGNLPDDFVPAWQHMHDIFEREGATNVTWVWSVNAANLPDSADNQWGDYYPGDEYVDWIGMSGFNFGTSRGGDWKTFSTIYEGPLKYLKTLDKPIVIAEMASVSNGGDKGAWIYDTYAKIILEHPEIKAVVYYNKGEKGLKGVQDWGLTPRSDEALAYKDAVSDPYFIEGPTPELKAWGDALKASEWVYLQEIKPIY